MKNSEKNSSWVGLTLLAMTFLLPDKVFAENVLEEITVTARRRQESLQEVPVSVSAFTKSALEERSLTDLGDIDQFIPNLVHTEGLAGGSSGQYRIRGAGQDDFVTTNEPSVGIYLDGVYIGRVAGAALDLLDIDRVEVMRGPQGTLYGRNTIGGAVNVITKDPDNQFGGYVEGVYGSRDRFDFLGSVNIPIIEDMLAIRAAYVHHEEDGWIDSLDNGRTFGDENRDGVRISGLFTPNQQFRLRFSADYTKDDGEADPSSATRIEPTSFIPPNFAVPENNENTYSGFRPGNNAEVWGVAADWTWDFGPGSLRSISSYRDLEHLSGIDFDGTPFNFFDQLNTVVQDQFSQELHLLGNFMEGRVDYLLGGFYFSEDITGTFHYPLGPVMLEEQNVIDNSSVAVFFNVDFALTNRFNLGGGVRYTEEDRDIFYNHNFQAPGPNGVVNGFLTQPLTDIVAVMPAYPPGTDLDRKLSFNATTWRVSADFDLNDDIMLFASISEGFRSGGFNGRPFGNPLALTTFGPETLRSYELGFKSDLAGGRLRLNGAIFFSDYTDMQFSAILAGSPSVVTDNAGEAEILGVEFEGHANLTDAFLLDFSIGYMDAEFTQLEPGVVANGIDLNDPIGLTPEWSYNIGGRYEHSVGDFGTLTARIDYSYTSKYPFLPQANEFDFQEGFGLANLNISFEPTNENWQLSIYGTNIFNEEYSYFKEDLRLTFLGHVLDFPAPGDEWGIRMAYRF